MLDLSNYTRAIKARILYNHLLVGGVPRWHTLALLDSGKLAQIVDHPNYNPRVVEWMTDAMRLEDIPARSYADAFLRALEDPAALWDKAFRTHISPACRHLLMALFFSPGFGCKISELRDAFETLHACLCRENNIERDPKDFEVSLKRIEGGFVDIDDQFVDFVNPSLRDYLADYLSDGTLLASVAATATRGRIAGQIWGFAERNLGDSPDELRIIASQFLPLLPRFCTAPRDLFEDSPSGDLDLADRLELLLSWWLCSGDERYLEAAFTIARSPPPDGFVAWRDGPQMLELIVELGDENCYESTDRIAELKAILDYAFMKSIEYYVPSDDVLRLSNLVEANSDAYSDELKGAMSAAIQNEFDSVRGICSGFTSESELDDHSDLLRQLAGRANVSKLTLEAALKTVERRLDRVREDQTESKEPAILKGAKVVDEGFDDDALRALFDGLRET